MRKGFTMVEMILASGIMLILIYAGISIYGNFNITRQFDDSEFRIIQILRIAQQKSISRYNDSEHGVFFEINPTGDDRVIMFQGDSYSTRDTLYDRPYTLPSVMSLATTISGSEVVFSRGFGRPNNIGTITLTHSVLGSGDITLNSFGIVQ